MRVIHILRAGLALCRFNQTVPMQWPEGHFWVAYYDPDPATCEDCKKVLAAERAEKQKKGAEQ